MVIILLQAGTWTGVQYERCATSLLGVHAQPQYTWPGTTSALMLGATEWISKHPKVEIVRDRT